MQNAVLNKVNPHFGSKYADLARIRDTVTPSLSKHGISVIQFTSATDAGFYLVTRLLHESGDYIDSVYPMDANTLKPQAMGSAMTYARRYCLAAICNIAAEEDDDGEAAQNANGGGRAKATSSGAKPRGGSSSDGGSPGGGIVL